MSNQKLAEIFYEIADLLELQGVNWKPQAYRKAAKSIELLEKDVSEIDEQGMKSLEEIPGVGEGIAKKIHEFVKTGRIKGYERLKKSTPLDLSKLLEIQSMGPKKALVLYQKLGIKSVKDLEKAAKAGKIAKLEHFGEKSQKDILEGIELMKKRSERMLLSEAVPVVEDLIKWMKSSKFIDKIEACGSFRRRRETIGDIDIVCTSKNPSAAMDRFVSIPNIKKILAKGLNKSMIILDSGIQVDLRVFSDESFGSALQYNTGGIPHGVTVRKIAIKKGYKLNEYGLFDRKTGRMVAGRTEDEIYKKLGFKQTPPPELRELSGEIQAGILGRLPKLIEEKDIRGDLHVHTNWSDGSASIEEMAKSAKALGYEYLCISDHSKAQRISHGLDEDRLLKQIAEIRKVEKKVGIRLLAGCEVDIMSDGSLDLSNKVLQKLDLVIASMHRGFKATEKQVTDALVSALNNPYVDILGHPTGEIINVRKPYLVNLDILFKVAKENNKVLEINAAPDRLDLRDMNIRKAMENGINLSIGTDAHSPETLKWMKFGVWQARRGWCESKNIVNTYTYAQLKKVFPRLK